MLAIHYLNIEQKSEPNLLNSDETFYFINTDLRLTISKKKKVNFIGFLSVNDKILKVTFFYK